MYATPTMLAPVLYAAVLACGVLVGPADAATNYKQVDWPQGGLPTGTDMWTAAAVDAATGTVYLGQRGLGYPNPILVYSRAGVFQTSFGNDTIVKNAAQWGIHGMNFGVYGPEGEPALWVTDVLGHTVKVLSPAGKVLATLGTGHAGTSTSPLAFGNVADVGFDPAKHLAVVSDGDKGVNSRVIGFNNTDAPTPLFITGQHGSAPNEYSSPHSVAIHQPTGSILIADRGNSRIKQLNTNGSLVSTWTCMRPGTPWGLRILKSNNLLFQADGNSSDLTVYSLDAATPATLGDCTSAIVQTIVLSPAACHTPHELAVDEATGDVFLACVATNGSNLIKFSP